MQFTINMLIAALDSNTTADGVFSSLEMQMAAQGKEDTAQKFTRAQIVSQTNMAIGFFLRSQVIDRALEETAKTQEELEKLLDEMKTYSA